MKKLNMKKPSALTGVLVGLVTFSTIGVVTLSTLGSASAYPTSSDVAIAKNYIAIYKTAIADVKTQISLLNKVKAKSKPGSAAYNKAVHSITVLTTKLALLGHRRILAERLLVVNETGYQASGSTN